MKYEDLLAGIRRYGVQDQDLCMNQLGVPSDHIQENVLIAPWWEPAMFPQLGEVKDRSSGRSKTSVRLHRRASKCGTSSIKNAACI